MEVYSSGLEGKNVLITGGLGFLGSNLARRLVNNGTNVTTVGLPGESTKNLRGLDDRLKVLQGRIDSNADLVDLVKGKDAVFHFAWQTEIEKALEDPARDVCNDIGGLINLLETSRKVNPDVKIVFPSTVTVTGIPEKLPVDEITPENPPTPYELNKLTAEKYLSYYFNRYGIKSTCLRLANVFGEGQRIDNPKRGILNFFIGRALNGENITVYGNGQLIRDYSYVSNFIDAFISAAESDKTDGEVYVLGSGEGRSFNEVSALIKKFARDIYGKAISVNHVAVPETLHSINMRNFIANPAKFKRDTGWKPKVSFEEGLKRTMEFYKNG